MSLPSQSWVIVATSTADWTCKHLHGVLPDPAHPCIDRSAAETAALLACTGIAADDIELVIDYAQADFGADIEERLFYVRQGTANLEITEAPASAMAGRGR